MIGSACERAGFWASLLKKPNASHHFGGCEGNAPTVIDKATGKRRVVPMEVTGHSMSAALELARIINGTKRLSAEATRFDLLWHQSSHSVGATVEHQKYPADIYQINGPM